MAQVSGELMAAIPYAHAEVRNVTENLRSVATHRCVTNNYRPVRLDRIRATPHEPRSHRPLQATTGEEIFSLGNVSFACIYQNHPVKLTSNLELRPS